MQKIAIGILGLLVLFLAATNARLSERVRWLESRPGPRPAPSRPVAAAPVAAPPAIVEKPAPIPTPAAVETPRPATLDASAIYRSGIPEESRWVDAGVASFRVLTRRAAPADLGLSEGQKQAIEALKRNRDFQTQIYRDQIKQIEDQTEQAIRQLLDSRQLSVYDGQNGQVELETHLTLQSGEVPQETAVQNSGYLGVTADSVTGGGAKITSILPNSAAGRFGLQQNDVVLDLNGEPVGDFAGLAKLIRARRSGEYVTLRIRRGDAVFNQGVELGGN